MTQTDSQDDPFLFADGHAEEHHRDPAPELKPWQILVVDDDPEVHSITRIVLKKFSFRKRGANLISAYSASDARRLLRDVPDIALILLDVVMETDDAGLRLVPYIRDETGNHAVRIILRTGQPGQAPEQEVIVNYDINDYKAKTELTAQKLITATVAALRSYEHIKALELSRRGLEKIIEASSSLFQQRSLQLFAAGVLTQVSALLGVGEQGILCVRQGDQSGRDRGEIYVLAGSGRFESAANRPVRGTVDDHIADFVFLSMQLRHSQYEEERCALFLETPNRRESVIYIDTGMPLSPLDRQLVEVFCAKIAVGFDNIYLYEDVKRAHEATVVALADLAEYKDNDTGEHVLRVTRTVDAIARQLRTAGHYPEILDDLFIERVGTASILHDVGKVSTPDSILLKPGPLDPDERQIMERHAQTGGAILLRAGQMVHGSGYLSMGAEIANGHHEWFDGKGYPRGLSGQNIPLSARITAVADVFDALTSKRPYKEPWPVERAVAYIRERAGTQFDPMVVEAFLAVLGQQCG